MYLHAEEERRGLPAFCGVESDGRNSGGGKLKVLRSDNGGCGILYIVLPMMLLCHCGNVHCGNVVFPVIAPACTCLLSVV